MVHICFLLGAASPGASTAVSIILDLIERCLKTNLKLPITKKKLKVVIQLLASF
jgi:L-2-hydroxyglutarate oxidase LhgO